MKNNNIYNSVSINQCVGCGTCESLCPKNCIHLEKGYKGFLYPVVKEGTCVDCGACTNKCPVLRSVGQFPPKNIYAAKVKDVTLLSKCTSGGIFSALAISVLNGGGVVCGACWTESFEVEHKCIYEVKDLPLLQGSKYVQSRANTCFAEIKNKLSNKYTVLFSGTGCQIAGLKLYLGETYSNLITIELVCHGVPSPGLFNTYVKWLENRINVPISKFCFRSKHRRPTGEHCDFYYYSNSDCFIGKAYSDPYYGSFLKGTTLRPSCYNCKYKGEHRVADFTIGDFWGIEKFHKPIHSGKGISLVMINSERAHEIFDGIKDEIDFVEAKWNEVISCNTTIVESVKAVPLEYDINSPTLFTKDLKIHLSFRNILKQYIPWQCKYYLKKILSWI